MSLSSLEDFRQALTDKEFQAIAESGKYGYQKGRGCCGDITCCHFGAQFSNAEDLEKFKKDNAVKLDFEYRDKRKYGDYEKECIEFSKNINLKDFAIYKK